MLQISLRTGLAVVLAATLSGCVMNKQAPAYQTSRTAAPLQTAAAAADKPALVVTNDPPPGIVYRRGSHDTVLAGPAAAPAVAPDITTPLASQMIETPVTQKAWELSREFDRLRGNSDGYKQRLRELENRSDAQAADYYALVASINADLQNGTTRGNPILVDRWNAAMNKLNNLSDSATLLNTLAMDLSYQASNASYLLESTRAAFAISGAVDADHKKLVALEDDINEDLIAVNRLMTQVNDDLTRRSNYLRTERANLQTLALAIGNGELYGKSIINGIFKRATDGDQSLLNGGAFNNISPAAGTKTAPVADISAFANRRPLVVVRFDHDNVEFDRPLYAAVNQALEKYPAAKFDLVAVSTGSGNPAEVALSTSAARKNGQDVMRSLTQMGVPLERLTLSAASSKDVLNSEVRLYIQ